MKSLKRLGKRIHETVTWARREPPPIAVDDVEWREDIRSDPDALEREVDEMQRQLMEKYPNHLPSREIMRACLRCRRYQMFLAEPLCERFIEFRLEHNWPFQIRARQVEQELRSNIHWALQGRDRLGRGIIVMNTRYLVNKEVPTDMAQMMGVYLMQKLSEDPAVQEEGLVFIIDMRDTPLSIILDYSIADWRRGTAGQRWFPARLKAFYFVNVSSAFSPFISMSLMALHEKMRGRITICKEGVEQLHEYIEPEHLPPELGGTYQLNWQQWVDDVLREEELRVNDE